MAHRPEVFFKMFASHTHTFSSSLLLCRTETVVEKLLTNWMSICLYAFLRVSRSSDSTAVLCEKLPSC